MKKGPPRDIFDVLKSRVPVVFEVVPWSGESLRDKGSHRKGHSEKYAWFSREALKGRGCDIPDQFPHEKVSHESKFAGPTYKTCCTHKLEGHQCLPGALTIFTRDLMKRTSTMY